MTTLPPFKESRDKVWNAYFRDEIQPNQQEFCFCGTICGNDDIWWGDFGRHSDFNGFSGKDFRRMELALFNSFPDTDHIGVQTPEDHPYWEDFLFSGMVAAYEEMKKIYIERGLEVDDFQPVKRETKV